MSNRKQLDWRDLPQGNRKKTTKVARKRRWMRICKASGLTLLLCALVGGFVYSLYFAGSSIPQMDDLSRHQPVRQVTFITDGVLDETWLFRKIGLTSQTDISSIDIQAIKNTLEGVGQIKEASVSRNLPGELIVSVRECSPVLRAATADDKGRRIRLLIARDGTVFEGINYPAKALRSLPYIGGVRFSRAEDGSILPIKGMDVVAELLEKARNRMPEIYSTWTVVSCDRFSGDVSKPDALIKIKSKLIEELTFKPENFDLQIERLAEVIQFVQAEHRTDILSIDLSYADQAVVSYADPRGPRS